MFNIIVQPYLQLNSVLDFISQLQIQSADFEYTDGIFFALLYILAGHYISWH